MTLERALALLGTDTLPLTDGHLMLLYREALRAVHPDTGTGALLPADIQEARRIVAARMTGENNACAQCQGHGTVRARIGRVTCGACHGTGERQS